MTEDLCLKFLKKYKKLSRKELAQKADRTLTSIDRALFKLLRDGKVNRVLEKFKIGHIVGFRLYYYINSKHLYSGVN